MKNMADFEVGSPHDGAFKSAFQKRYLAKNFFRCYLPENIAKHIDFRYLSLVNKSYVDEKLRAKHSDIVYRTKIRGMPALLYFLFEHQSGSDQMMPFRTLSYEDNIWKEYLDQNPKEKKLPVIIPAVLYNGASKWSAPLNFRETVEGGELFSEYLPDFKYELIDLSDYDDAELAGDIALRFVLHTFKHIYDGDIDAAFRLADDFLEELQKAPTFLELLEWFLWYVYHARTEDDKKLKKKIDQIAERLTAKEVNEMALTVAQRIEQRGWKKGWEQGEKKGEEKGEKKGEKKAKRETAANFLKLGVDMKTVILATGLTEKELTDLINGS